MSRVRVQNWSREIGPENARLKTNLLGVDVLRHATYDVCDTLFIQQLSDFTHAATERFIKHEETCDGQTGYKIRTMWKKVISHLTLLVSLQCTSTPIIPGWAKKPDHF